MCGKFCIQDFYVCVVNALCKLHFGIFFLFVSTTKPNTFNILFCYLLVHISYNMHCSEQYKILTLNKTKKIKGMSHSLSLCKAENKSKCK